MPELAQLLKGKSMMRYLPPYDTAGFAIFLVKAFKRVPLPPARIMAANLVDMFLKPFF